MYYVNLMRFRPNQKASKALKAAKLRERALKGVAARAAKRQARAADAPEEPHRIPAGEHLGVLTWHAADGTVRRWTVRQGPRSNNIEVGACGKRIRCGWDRFLCGLRKHLAQPKRRWATT